MATNVRYYPEGFIGTEQAAVLLAKLLHEERWREKFFDDEQQVWDSLGFQLNAELIDCFIADVRRKVHLSDPFLDTGSMFERFLDFGEAVQILQRALHAGRPQAQFCDENGRFDFIRKEGWGGDAGVDALLTGVAVLDDGFKRLVLLPEAEIEELGRSLIARGKRHSEKSGSEERPKNAPLHPLQSAEDLFREWRDQAEREGRIPTYQEDVAHMKSLGIGRDQVRKLRENYPRLRRGEHRQRLEQARNASQPRTLIGG